MDYEQIDDNEIIEFTVHECEDFARLDSVCAKYSDISRSRCNELIAQGKVTVNGCIKKASHKLSAGECVAIILPPPIDCNAVPEDIAIEIIYQDKDIAVVNKPQGMITHPASGTYSGTLVNALMYHLDSLSTINGVVRPGIVHRLDKDTSGLLVVAKNDKAHSSLSAQIAIKTARRIYRAIVDGNIANDSGTIDQPIGRSTKDRKLMAVVAGGRNAVTKYKVLERFGNYTYCEFELLTGRTHQIRVHSRYIKHSIIGDTVYGGSNRFKLQGQLLHAYKLILTHPTSGEIMEFVAPLPDYFTKVLQQLAPMAR